MKWWNVAVALIVLAILAVLALLIRWRVNVSKREIAHQKLVAEASSEANEIDDPERAAWERLLIERLGSFYLPRYMAAKRIGTETEWDYVEEDGRLPRVLIIGDSISRGYTLPVRHALAGVANVIRAPENCGSSENGVALLDKWLGKNSDYDVIVVNFGIHDRGRPLDAYGSDIETILKRLKRHANTLIWVTTTQLPGFPEKIADFLSFEQYKALAMYRRGHNSADLNAVATPLAEAVGAQVFDLDNFVALNLKQEMLEYDVHYSLEGYRRMGLQIAPAIKRVLNGSGT